MYPGSNNTPFTLQCSTGYPGPSEYVSSKQPLALNLRSVRTEAGWKGDPSYNLRNGPCVGKYKVPISDIHKHRPGLPECFYSSFDTTINSNEYNANLSLSNLNHNVKNRTITDVQTENRKRNDHCKEFDEKQKKRRISTASDEQKSFGIKSSFAIPAGKDKHGTENCKEDFFWDEGSISDQLKTVHRSNAEAYANYRPFNHTDADTCLTSDIHYSKRSVDFREPKSPNGMQDHAIRLSFDQESVGNVKKSPTFSITDKEHLVSTAMSVDKITALAKHKLNSVKDHYLLSKPMSLQDASKLFCSNKIDTEFKKSLASRIQRKQVIGVGSAKQAESYYSQQGVFIEPNNDNQSYKCSIYSQTKKAEPTKVLNLTKRMQKYDGTNRDTICQVCPAYDPPTDFSHVHQENSNSQENVGNLLGNIKTNEHPKKLFYIVSNGSQVKTNTDNTEQEVKDKPGMSETLEEFSKHGKSKNCGRGSYVINGLVVASPKPITQEIYKQLQADTNILKSLKAPVCTEPSVKAFNPIIQPSSSSKMTKQANENNNRTQLTDMQLYHSKLTVAQLLKHKRSEEQLEIMLKSKLNMSSNALNKTSDKPNEQSTSKNILPQEQANSNNESKNHEAQALSPDHSYIRSLGNCSGSQTCSTSLKDAEPGNKKSPEEKTDPKTIDGIDISQIENADQNQKTIQTKAGKTNSNCNGMALGNRLGTFSVKVGCKMVIMRKPSTTTSPESLKENRKKLPAPKPRKEHALAVKKDTITRLKNKIKRRSKNPKDILVEKLKLMPKSKLVKKLSAVKEQKYHHYSIDAKNSNVKEVANANSSHLTMGNFDFHDEHDGKCCNDTFAPVLQLWKESEGSFKHNIQIVKFDIVSKDSSRFHRWYEYSDYPCIIYTTWNDTITRIETGNIKKGFYLLTRTDNASTSECDDQEMPASLSPYPTNLSLLPNSSRALVIGTVLDAEESHENVLSQFDKYDLDLDDLIRLLLPTTQDLSSTKDERYISVVEKTMSPRICSPTFYSNNMRAYFSDINKTDNVKSYDTKTGKNNAIVKSTSKSKFLTKLPSCSSKAAALKKKQNELLKTCQKLKKVRRLESTEKAAIPLAITKPTERNTPTIEPSVCNNENLNESHDVQAAASEDTIVDVINDNSVV